LDFELVLLVVVEILGTVLVLLVVAEILDFVLVQLVFVHFVLIDDDESLVLIDDDEGHGLIDNDEILVALLVLSGLFRFYLISEI